MVSINTGVTDLILRSKSRSFMHRQRAKEISLFQLITTWTRTGWMLSLDIHREARIDRGHRSRRDSEQIRCSTDCRYRQSGVQRQDLRCTGISMKPQVCGEGTGFQQLYVEHALSIPDKLIHCQSNILTDLPQQDRGNIPARVEWNSRTPSIRMPELLMRTALAYLLKTKLYQNSGDFLRFQDRKLSHSMPP
jgi:hypothetical protein